MPVLEGSKAPARVMTLASSGCALLLSGGNSKWFSAPCVVCDSRLQRVRSSNIMCFHARSPVQELGFPTSPCARRLVAAQQLAQGIAEVQLAVVVVLNDVSLAI